MREPVLSWITEHTAWNRPVRASSPQAASAFVRKRELGGEPSVGCCTGACAEGAFQPVDMPSCYSHLECDLGQRRGQTRQKLEPTGV